MVLFSMEIKCQLIKVLLQVKPTKFIKKISKQV